MAVAEQPLVDNAVLRVFYQSTLDAMTSNVAVVDAGGRVIATNVSWRAFLTENEIQEPGFEVGGDILGAYQAAGDPDSLAIAAGVRSLLAGGPGPIRRQYRCPWTRGERWSALTAVRLGPLQTPFAIISHEDITEERAASERRIEAAGRLLLAEDENRRRLAVDLHDGIAQTLAAAKLKLGAGRTEEAQSLLGEAIGSLRAISTRLLPPMIGPLGLCAGLRDAAQAFERRTGRDVDLDLPCNDPLRLPLAHELTLYRIAEAVLAAAEANGGRVELALRLGGGTVSLSAPLAAESADVLDGLRLRVEHLGGTWSNADGRLAATLPLIDREGDGGPD